MSSIGQGEEGQQLPVVVDGGIVSFFYSYPALHFGSTTQGVS